MCEPLSKMYKVVKHVVDETRCETSYEMYKVLLTLLPTGHPMLLQR